MRPCSRLTCFMTADGYCPVCGQQRSALERISILKTAMEKVISYNHDIAAGRINYRPQDHIQVLQEALEQTFDHVGNPKP